MNIQTLTLGPLATNCYLVRAEESRRAVIIDPAANSKRLLAALEEQGLTLEAILLTHAHFDHIGALKNLRAATNARYERISEQKPRNRLTKFAASCIINDWFRDGLHRGNTVRARLSWRLLPLLL